MDPRQISWILSQNVSPKIVKRGVISARKHLTILILLTLSTELNATFVDYNLFWRNYTFTAIIQNNNLETNYCMTDSIFLEHFVLPMSVRLLQKKHPLY
jgi:hypothetical protein